MTLDYQNPLHRPTRRSHAWLKVIGWSVGALVVLFLVASFFLPTITRARESANRLKCFSNLRQIGYAASLYANDHNGQLPPDLPTILQTQEIDAAVFTCPSSDVDIATGATTQQVVAEMLSGKHLSYAWTGAGVASNAPSDTILAFDLEHHVPKDSARTTGINVLLNDGSVTFVNEATANAIWAQFVAGVRPIRLSTCAAPATAAPAPSP